MDLVFKRYSSPFLLFDNLIENREFLNFIMNLLETYEDEQIYELWLHKCFDQTYVEFKNEIKNKKNQDVSPEQSLDDTEIEKIINENYEMLNNFKPC